MTSLILTVSNSFLINLGYLHVCVNNPITPTPTPTLSPQSPPLSKTGAQDGLLDWVQPRTEKHYDVNNFTTSWKDGIALLALFDNIKPGVIDMDEIMANEDDIEAHLAQGFDLFEEHLGVPKMLEVKDLMVSKPDKKSVMTYISAIKNATQKYEEERAKHALDEQQMHKNRGEELYAQGLAKYAQASADDESCLDDIVADAIPELNECDGSDEEFERIKEEAHHKLKDATVRYVRMT